MTHVDAGTLVSLRDEPGRVAPGYAHVSACPACAAALVDASGRAALISETLASLDVPIDLPAAKAAARARLDRARSRAPGGGWRRWPIGRAATLLLATAGAASALTWTPVRNLWNPPAPRVSPTAAPAPLVTAPAGRLLEASGVAVEVGSGSIAVVVRGAAPGATVEVVWSAGGTARVSGPTGSGFTYGGGRLEVEATPGDLRIELPRSASSSLEVGGRVYVTRSTAGVSASGPALERTDDRIRFVVPGP